MRDHHSSEVKSKENSSGECTTSSDSEAGININISPLLATRNAGTFGYKLPKKPYVVVSKSGRKQLRKVDAIASKYVYGILDEGCNSCCHGERWARDANRKLAKLGYRIDEIDNNPRMISGIGEGRTNGKYAVPYALRSIEGQTIAGIMTSHQIADASHPILISIEMQAKLGLIKDVRAGTIAHQDYPDERLEIVRQKVQAYSRSG